MHPPPPRIACAVALVLASCATPATEAATPQDPALADAVAALLQAAPHEWLAKAERVFAFGPAAGDPLVAALREDASGPGATAAVALLGRLGGRGVPFLGEQVADRTPLATEAALALGEARAAEANGVLRACVADRFADATLRTAAACALVRTGERAAAAGLLHAVLLAGTPDGQPLQREHGLPQKSRWALERYMIQRLLLQEAGKDFGLDTDAPWPQLAASTAEIMAWLQRP